MRTKPYAIELPGTKKEGETGIYQAIDAHEIVEAFERYPKTVYQLFLNAVEKTPENEFLGTREKKGEVLGDYVFQTYSEVYERVNNLSNGLEYLIRSENLYKNKPLKAIGIYSANRSEWVISDLANVFRSYATVALYNTYGLDVLNYVASHSEMELLILSIEKLNFLINNNNALPQIKVLICMDEIKDNSKYLKWAKEKGIKLVSFNEVELIGKQNTFKLNPPIPDTIYTLCYTSGTTGMPKGVISTHENYTGCSFLKELVYGELRPATTYSYLPLAHTMERSNILLTMHYEARVGFNSGSILNFADDIKVLKPTSLAAVPRILVKLYDTIQTACNQDHPNAKVLKQAIKEKLENFRAGKGVKSAKWDPILVKFREAFGGKVDLIGFGSAPISKEALDVLRVCLSANMFESYGATETSSGMTASLLGDTESGHVGPPFKNIKVKLVDIPEMGYLSSDKPYPRGEICVKGFSIFKGYYKNEKATKEALTEDGWFLTGDVGKIDELGRLYIIDRKSNMFKLSQGEFVAPERIENQINRHPAVLQSLVYGSSLHPFVVAMIIPDPEGYIKWAKTHLNNKELTIENAYKDESLKKKLLEELKTHSKNAGLAGFEIIRHIHIQSDPFSIENGLLTDTYKIKRKVIYKEFKSIFDGFYNQ